MNTRLYSGETLITFRSIISWYFVESPTQDKRKSQSASEALANRKVIMSSVSSGGWVSDDVDAVIFGTRKQVVSMIS